MCACVHAWPHSCVYFTHMWLWKPVMKKASEGKINQRASDSCPFASRLPIPPHMPHVPQEMTGCLALLAQLHVCMFGTGPLSLSSSGCISSLFTQLHDRPASQVFTCATDQKRKGTKRWLGDTAAVANSSRRDHLLYRANKEMLAKQWRLGGSMPRWSSKDKVWGRQLALPQKYQFSLIQIGTDNA